MINLPNIAEWRTYCGFPVDIVDGVMIACKNESIGRATLEFDDETVEVEVCQEHYDGLDKAGAHVLD